MPGFFLLFLAFLLVGGGQEASPPKHPPDADAMFEAFAERLQKAPALNLRFSARAGGRRGRFRGASSCGETGKSASNSRR